MKFRPKIWKFVPCCDDLIVAECQNLLIIFTDTSQSQYWVVNERGQGGRYLVFTFANYCWVGMIYEVSIVSDGLLGCNYAHAGYLELSLIVMSPHVSLHFHLCSKWLRWRTESRVANCSWEIMRSSVQCWPILIKTAGNCKFDYVAPPLVSYHHSCHELTKLFSTNITKYILKPW